MITGLYRFFDFRKNAVFLCGIFSQFIPYGLNLFPDGIVEGGSGIGVVEFFGCDYIRTDFGDQPAPSAKERSTVSSKIPPSMITFFLAGNFSQFRIFSHTVAGGSPKSLLRSSAVKSSNTSSSVRYSLSFSR